MTNVRSTNGSSNRSRYPYRDADTGFLRDAPAKNIEKVWLLSQLGTNLQ